MAEITDKHIVLVSLDYHAIALWHEVERGGRFFGVGIYVDVVERIVQIKKSIKERGTEYCLLLPVD